MTIPNPYELDSLDELRERLVEAEQTLAAIRNGEVDALIVRAPAGDDHIFTLKGADWAYRVMVEQMHEGAATVGADGTVLYCNRRFAEMTGHTLETVIGSRFSEAVAGGDRDAVAGLFEGRPATAEVVLAPLGTAGTAGLPVRLSASPLSGELGGCVSMLVMDLSDARHRGRLEGLVQERTAEIERINASLRLSERLAAMGTLAAGLGHDMANILLPVRVRLEALAAGESGAQAREDVDAIRSAVDYLQRLASGLRLLALDPDHAGEAAASVSVDAEEWWAESGPVLKTALPSGVTLTTDIAPGLPALAIGGAPLTQAVFNLVQNAGDALRGRGKGRVRVSCREAGALVHIVVEDDGPGMTEEVRRRCLEPFFTTKPRTLSTGMGLPFVHGIITRAGGTVEVESWPGKGTRFTLTVPARARAEGAEREAPEAVISVGEPQAGAYLETVLRRLGCRARQGDRPEKGTELWVVAAQRAEPGLLRAFLDARETRRALVLEDGVGAPAHPRVHALGPDADAGRVRTELSRVVEAFRR